MGLYIATQRSENQLSSYKSQTFNRSQTKKVLSFESLLSLDLSAVYEYN